jgi:copper oxidase (laccase) domain-containing protein
MAEASYFLDGVNRCGAIRSDFVGRVGGVEVSTDKGATLARLEPAHREAVERLGFSWAQLRRAEQVHGAEVAVVTGEEEPVVAGVDGLICGVPGIVLGIYVADCAAVYLVDRVTGAIGLVHSGKKGSELGIVRVAVEEMAEQFGTRPEDLEVAIAPCIRPPHYEVDFAACIRDQLRELGVRDGSLCDSGRCTGAEVAEYYSYRVEEGCTGRMLALLGRPGHEEVGA